MNAAAIVIIILALLIIVALVILYKTRGRLKEMDGFRKINEPGKDTDEDEDVIDSFGD